MAILFSCPYCTASVKVPDQAAGKVGACPKCGTKIRVPIVGPPASSLSTPQSPRTVERLEPANAPHPHVVATAPSPLPDTTQFPVSVVPSEPHYPDLFTAPPPVAVPFQPAEAAKTVTPTADPFDFSSVAMSVGPAATSSETSALQRAAPRKKTIPSKRISGKVLALLAVVLLVAAGIGVWIKIQNLPVYQGAVVGKRVPSGQTITVTVPWASIEIPGGVQTQVIEYFKRHQTSLANNLLKIDLNASPQGLTVRFATTEDSILVSVDPQQIPDIKTLIAENQTAWEAARERELKQFAQELCTHVAKAQTTGTRVESVSTYRDTVALNALVHGLGRHCVCIANKTTHPCVFEDQQGILHFAVPEQVKEIIVVEKTVEGRAKQLPPDFEIRTSVPPAESATPRFEKEATEDPVEESVPVPASEPASSGEMPEMKSAEDGMSDDMPALQDTQ